MTTTITNFIQSIKERLAKVKAWLDFKRPEGKKESNLGLFDRFRHLYASKRTKNKVFGFLVVLKMAMIVFMAWCLGHYLIPMLDAKVWIGNMARVILSLSITWFFVVILSVVFRYKPIRRDRLLFGHSKRGRYGWGMLFYSIIAVLIIVTYICAVAFVVLQARSHDQVHSEYSQTLGIFWGVISQFADPGNLPQAVGWGKLVAFLSAFAGILCLSGLGITSLVSMINRRSQDWQRGLTRYEGDFNNYIVIIGLNEQTATIVKKALRRVQYVIIQTNKNVEEQRAKLELKLDRDDEERVVFYFGERTVYEDICDLHLENTREVYILGEEMDNGKEQDHDSYNMKCLELISQYCEELSKNKSNVNTSWWGKRLKCHVELEYQSTYTIFKATHIYKRLNQNVEFIPFNVYEIWAKKVLVDNYAILPGKKHDEHLVQRYQPIDSYRDPVTHEIKGITYDSDKSVHLIIAGMNQMGIALAMQTALLVHLPNYYTKGIRTTISFISEHAARESEFLMGHYEALFALCRHRTIYANRLSSIKTWEEDNLSNVDPMATAKSRYSYLGSNFMDIQWEFIEGSMASSCVRDYLIRETSDPKQTCTIAVCNNDPQKSIATALYLPELVQKRVQQVLVYQRNSFDLINKVATGEKQWKRYEKLKPFGMIADCYKDNMYDAIMPKLVLALYKSSEKKPEERTIKIRRYESIDAYIDHIDDLWSDEGIVKKLLNINAAESFNSKLRSAGLSENSTVIDMNRVLNNTSIFNTLVAAEHQRRVTERLTIGYRPLDAAEMNFFENLAKEKTEEKLSDEGNAKKDYFKNKSRAHLMICSMSQLAKVYPDQREKDRIIMKNVIRGTFFNIEAMIISRLALKGGTRDEGLLVAASLLNEMVQIKKAKLKVSQKGSVIIPSMLVCQCPVKQELWKQVMGKENNPSYDGSDLTDKHPVNNVSKEDVEDFILILNDLTGLRFSLPTRYEWYYAALGGCAIHEFSKTINIADYAWTQKDENPKVKIHTHPVRKKKKNGYGLYDMLGNVWEWTRTSSAASTFDFCGGSWRYSERECDLSDVNGSWCNAWIPEHKSNDLGFRLVLYQSFNLEDINNQVQTAKEDKERIIIDIAKNKRMVLVHGGEFALGANVKANESGHGEVDLLPNEGCVHQVKVSTFHISSIPVTQRQYKVIMGHNPSEQKGDYLPVENVSYHDAQSFIDKLNQMCLDLLPDDIVPPDGKIFDLPTQAQWEFAARGGTASKGTLYSGSDNPDVVAWHYGITKGIHAVGQKNPNELELYDMCGNVWEWCSDWYQSNYYEESEKKGVVENPKGPSSGNTRVLRGGSWRFTANECRLIKVAHWPEDYKANDVGFRLVSNVEPDVIEKLLKAVKGKD